MNELIGSFAGKRLAAFGALIAAIALLATGGVLSRTADAQTIPADQPAWIAEAERAPRAGAGLDHIVNNARVDARKITLATNTRHHVCLVENLHAQAFRGDSGPSSMPPEADSVNPGDNHQVDSDQDGMTEAASDIDDWDWGLAAAPIGGDPAILTEVGPTGILTAAPAAAQGSTGEASVTGWNWVVAKKANTAGTPTLTNPTRTFPNKGHEENGAEACVHWTSTAPGTQVVRLYFNTDVVAVARGVVNAARRDSDTQYARPLAGDDGDIETTADNRHDDDWDFSDFQYTDLEVTWIDSDPLIQVTRTIGNFAPTAVTAPIAQRMDFVGGAPAAASFTSEGGGEIAVSVAAVQSQLMRQALVGASVSFAVTGTCGIVTVPGAIVSTSPVLVRDDIRPGQTGTIANWGTDPVTATFKNAGTGASDSYPQCRLSSSSTTLTITSGSATNTVTVNWNWDGYGVFTLDEVDDTTKRVNFHSATPKSYNALGQSVGWECDAVNQARVLNYNVDGRATVVGGARVGESSPTVVTATSQGRATPQRTLGAGDSECQVSWTIKSPSRAADVYVDITTLGVDAYSEVLSFAPEAPAVTTFDDLEAPLVPGNSQVIWTGGSTAVADAIGDSGATAVYLWVNATQSWLAFFPGQEGLGVNSLTMLSNGDILFISTPSN